MKISNKRELQQIAFNHLSDIDFQGFMNLYKKCTAKPYSFFVIDTTLASEKLIMIIVDKIKDEKLQYNINREAPKVSALQSGKTDKYEDLTAEEILPSDQSRITEQVKFTYSPLGKIFEKQIKTIEEQGKKQVEVLEILKPNTQK